MEATPSAGGRRGDGAASPASIPGVAGIRTVEWRDGTVVMIDQRRLPLEEVYIHCRTWEEVADAIRTMAVRGAPALGVAAAMGMALAARAALRSGAGAPARFRAELQAASKGLFETRPTAYNLPWALREMERIWTRDDLAPSEVAEEMERLAVKIYEDDLVSCRAIGDNGAALIQEERPVILTHCNAGALATAGYGTALGVIRSVHARDPRLHVLVDETRPLLQGARLTAWELMREGISMELITDNMAGYFLNKGVVTHVVVGADRITANGDVANKIGTYSLSVLARENGVPFYVAAPFSTVDRCLPDGSAVPIEERAASEVTGFDAVRWAPPGVQVRNPAFDVTPARNVTAIITERGVAFPPYEESLERLDTLEER
ncbi:MAG: S-methyl-5-thioribose-1-phosphate isomerase [Actinomycetia bacterium]|nr:S-methyl-5-thioribose-1-phosphate isomerase [Actinomycetes bacterium]